MSSSPWTSSITKLLSATSTTLATCYNRLVAAPRAASTAAGPGITTFQASSLPLSTLGGAALSPSPPQPWTLTSSHFNRPIPTPKLLSAAMKSVPVTTPFKATSLPGFEAARCPQPPACVRVVATGYANHGYEKPNCSYTCLIAMSLMASQREALKTAEIYKYIQ